MGSCDESEEGRQPWGEELDAFLQALRGQYHISIFTSLQGFSYFFSLFFPFDPFGEDGDWGNDKI